MKKILLFPWLIIPFLYALYLIGNLQEVKTLADAHERFYALLNAGACTILLGLFQYLLLELWDQRQTDTFISWLDYLGKTNKRLNAMKNKSFMAHAKDWKFKEMDQPHYTK